MGFSAAAVETTKASVPAEQSSGLVAEARKTEEGRRKERGGGIEKGRRGKAAKEAIVEEH